ncbi:MAG: aminotransferase class V-fold PLP-dependent enzyme [Candidatus Bathyarchaeia archaeon]
MTLDVERIRKDFPILESGVIYLDNTATSLTPEPVLSKMLEYYREYRSNVERGIYAFSQRATDEYEKAHRKAAELIGANSPSEIVMVRNTTEAINTVANGLNWKPEHKVVTTLLEHHSNYLPLLRASRRYGVKLQLVKPSVEGTLDPADFEKTVDDSTRLVSVAYVSNVLGVITPVKEIAQIAHEHGALCLLDAAQAVPNFKVNVKDVGCDFLAFSGHKICGPTGCGVLYVNEDSLEKLEPLLLGGGAILNVDVDDYTLDRGGRGFEAGTPPIAEAIGLGAAIDYVRNIGFENIHQHEQKMTRRVYDGLVEMENVKLYGPEPSRKVGITSFNVGDLNPHDVALALDTSANIAVRSGHHCAQPLMKTVLNAPHGTVRASTYFYNTIDEIEKFLAVMEEITSALQ